MSDALHFVAVDLGASSGRVLCGQWDGSCVGLHELHRFANVPVAIAGGLHWDALRLWSEITHGLQQYARQFNAPLAGIGVDSWGVDFGLLDRNGRLIGNPYHYRDARTGGMIEAVDQIVPADQLFERTGIQTLPFNTIYQLMSMARNDDPQLRIADTLLMIPDLIHFWLTGHKTGEYTNASTTQLLDCRTRQWAGSLADQIGVPGTILPPLVQPGTILATIRPAIAAELGLDHTTPVIAPATHDTGSAVAAIPDLDRDSAFISSGTWSLVGVEVDQPITSDLARAVNVTNEGGVGGTIRLLKNVAGLWLLQESQRAWSRSGTPQSWDDLIRAANTAPPLRSLIDPDAPEFLAPADMPAAIRAFCRRTGQIAPNDGGSIVRCCLESLALRYRWVIDALERLTDRTLATIRVVGGGSQNALLNQMTADACNRPVVAGPVEATALGNLLLQAIATGAIRDIASGRRTIAASIERRVWQPQPRVDWDAAYDRFCDLIVRPG